LGPDPRRALGPAAKSAAQTGRTRDRTRPMLQQRQKVLAKAPSTRDPKRTLFASAVGPFQSATSSCYDGLYSDLGAGNEAARVNQSDCWPRGRVATIGARAAAKPRCGGSACYLPLPKTIHYRMPASRRSDWVCAIWNGSKDETFISNIGLPGPIWLRSISMLLSLSG